MKEYKLDSEKIKVMGGKITMWQVWSGRTSYGDFIKEEIVYKDESIADCLAWITAKKENLIL